MKQEIEYSQIRLMTYIEDENIIFVSTSAAICALNPVSPTNQINQQLESKRVDEALDLFSLLNRKLSQSEFEEVKYLLLLFNKSSFQFIDFKRN